MLVTALGVQHDLAREGLFLCILSVGEETLVTATAVIVVAYEHTLAVGSVVLHLAVIDPFAVVVADVPVCPHVGQHLTADACGVGQCDLFREEVVTSPFPVVNELAFLPVLRAALCSLGTVYFHIAVVGLEVLHVIARVFERVAVG